MTFANMLQQLLPVVDDVYERWTLESQAMKASLPTEIKISCQKGCGACCHFPMVPVTLGEAFVLLNHLLAAGYTLPSLQTMFIGYAERYFEIARDLGALPFDGARVQGFMKNVLPCPLFEKTPTASNPMSGHCGAFTVRPLVCDYFHSTDAPIHCARHEPHGTLTMVIQRGVQAVDEIRAFERTTYGWSVLVHLPLALAVLCTQPGLELFTTLRTSLCETEEAQALFEFEVFSKILKILGYELGENDLRSLALAQES